MQSKIVIEENYFVEEEEKALFWRRAGWLFKEGSSWKTWKKRWFVLSDHVIYYFEQQSGLEASPKGVLELQGCTVRTTDRVVNGYEVFEVAHPSRRTLALYADSGDEKRQWMDAINYNLRWQTRFRAKITERARAEVESLTTKLAAAEKAAQEAEARYHHLQLNITTRENDVKKQEAEVAIIPRLKAELEAIVQENQRLKEIQTEKERAEQKAQRAEIRVLELELALERAKSTGNNSNNSTSSSSNPQGPKSSSNATRKATKSRVAKVEQSGEFDQDGGVGGVGGGGGDSGLSLSIVSPSPSARQSIQRTEELEQEMKLIQQKLDQMTVDLLNSRDEISQLKSEKKILIKEIKRLTKAGI